MASTVRPVYGLQGADGWCGFCRYQLHTLKRSTKFIWTRRPDKRWEFCDEHFDIAHVQLQGNIDLEGPVTFEA